MFDFFAVSIVLDVLHKIWLSILLPWQQVFRAENHSDLEIRLEGTVNKWVVMRTEIVLAVKCVAWFFRNLTEIARFIFLM